MNLTIGELDFLIGCVLDVYEGLDEHELADRVIAKLEEAQNAAFLAKVRERWEEGET